MSTAKDDDDYWNTSDQRAFSFEDDEENNLFGISKIGTARLRAGISEIDVTESCMKSDESQTNLKPLLSVISRETLERILAADVQDVPEEQPVAQPDITLRRILLGRPFSLEQYKSLADKTALLDAAIASGDGNAILITVLFIARTLKRTLLQRLLIERPEAVNVYLRYLSTRLHTSELTDLLIMLGRSTDAAMRNLQIVLKNTTNPERLLQKLQHCYNTQFMLLAGCKETLFVHNYIKLLEWQLAVKNTGFSKPLELNSSVLQCLRHTCEDNWTASEGSLVAPTTLSRQHAVSPRQYQRVALTTRASMKAWNDVESLFSTKGWLGTRKMQLHLPIEDVLKILHESEAPSAVLEKFLGHVENLGKRLEMATKLQCHRAVIDILVLRRDRAALLEYKTSLHPQSEHYFYAENALRVSTTKWKN